jgi:rod shape-determining protein MreD
MKLLVVIVLMVVFVALQICLTPTIGIKDISPNLVLIFVFFVSFSFGQTYGMWTGFFSGFLCDLFDSTNFGLNMALFLTVGFVVGSMKPRFYRDNVFVEIIILAIVLLLYEIVYAILLWQFSIGIFFLNIFRFSIPRVFYSVVIGVILFPLLRKIPLFSEDH